MDKRPIVLAESVEVDFSTNRWEFAPLGQYAVGAGKYLLVPIEADAPWLGELRANLTSYLDSKRTWRASSDQP